MISIRPEVIEVAVEAARAVKGNKRAGVIAAIAVFCEAEGLTVERLDSERAQSNPYLLSKGAKQRLVGPWRSITEEKS